MGPVVGRGRFAVSQSAVLPREVKMLAIATAALIVLATTASSEPSYTRRVYGSEYKKYDGGHEGYKMSDYRHHDSYDEGYGGDAYSEKPTYTYEPRSAYRHKRQVQDDREGTHFPPECTRLVTEPKEMREEHSVQGAREPPEDMVLVDRWALFDGQGLNPRSGLHGMKGDLIPGGAHVSGGNCDHVMCDCYVKPSPPVCPHCTRPPPPCPHCPRPCPTC